ncbi:hypothetical protein HAX54_043493, partial [Datura stramonium]|nr:hypothetical protein [Datura stramonium]
ETRPFGLRRSGGRRGSFEHEAAARCVPEMTSARCEGCVQEIACRQCNRRCEQSRKSGLEAVERTTRAARTRCVGVGSRRTKQSCAVTPIARIEIVDSLIVDWQRRSNFPSPYGGWWCRGAYLCLYVRACGGGGASAKRRQPGH